MSNRGSDQFQKMENEERSANSWGKNLNGREKVLWTFAVTVRNGWETAKRRGLTRIQSQ